LSLQFQAQLKRLSKIETKQLTGVTPELEQFCKDCSALGYHNNSSIKAMKFDWCIQEGGAWWATRNNNNKIIAVTGIHPWLNGWRALFRGAQISSRAGLSKHHMTSWGFHSHLPLQIEYARQNEKYPENLSIYITTNTETDNSGKMLRINKTFNLLQRQGLVDNLGRAEAYGVVQNVWLLDVKRYTEIRQTYDRSSK